jgi:alcohol dehydrogenase (cytochrome c)
LLAISSAHAAGPTQAELNNAANESTDWPYVDHDYRGQRYTPLNEITAKNASDLAQVCSYTFPDKEPAQTASGSLSLPWKIAFPDDGDWRW